jgi:RND family efflux transporter MFP subunit
VSAHQQSVGQLVGNGGATTLATILQLDPIYAAFSISEQDVLRVRAEMARRGVKVDELNKVPVDVGLQTEQGYPHSGTLDYVAPSVDRTTGTLNVRGILANPDRTVLPGYFVRVRVPVGRDENANLVPDTAIGADQAGRYVLVVNADNVVEQHRVQVGVSQGGLRVILSGMKPDDRIVVDGLQRAIPGQKVEPKLVAVVNSAPAQPTPGGVSQSTDQKATP